MDESSSDATSLTIQAQATDNAATFTSTARNISSRTKTANSVSWSPAAWTSTGSAGLDQRTLNIASIIQEIVDRSGWSSGNSLAIVITGTGERTAESYDGLAGAAPLLHVEYSVGSGSNTAPTASFVDSCTDLDCDFTDESTDPDGTVTSWSWSFGDGGTSTAQNPSYTYAAAGDYAVTLTVTDDDGGTSAPATQMVTVTTPPPPNTAPTAASDAGTVAIGQTLNVEAPGVLANDSDPEGDALTVTTAPVTAPSNGTLTLNGDGSYSYAHDGSQTTGDTFVYRVCDPGGLCDTATVSITITGVVTPSVRVVTPVGSGGYATSGGKNSDLHLEITVSLVDGNGAPVANASVEATISGPTSRSFNGSTNSAGQVVFKHTNAPSGIYTTTVTAVSADGLTWDGTTPVNSFSK